MICSRKIKLKFRELIFGFNYLSEKNICFEFNEIYFDSNQNSPLSVSKEKIYRDPPQLLDECIKDDVP